jgi:hypothetical protein
MRNHTTVSDLDANDTSIRSGAHSQIWIGRDVDITLLFDNDREMFGWVHDLYGKTIAAMPDDIFAVQITETCSKCGHIQQDHVCESEVCISCPVGEKCVGFTTTD